MRQRAATLAGEVSRLRNIAVVLTGQIERSIRAIDYDLRDLQHRLAEAGATNRPVCRVGFSHEAGPVRGRPRMAGRRA